MQSSTARREKLVGPVQLAFIAVLFAVSFYFLIPDRDAFSIKASDPNAGSQAPITELDIAYLKARSAGNEASSTETTNAVSALIRTGQVEQARDLLIDQPDVRLDERQRIALDLEMANVELAAAGTDQMRDAKRLQLLNRIELVNDKPALRTRDLLRRAAELSEQVNSPETTLSLYLHLADHEKDNASVWYAKCGRSLATMRQAYRSANCFEKAVGFAKSTDEVFELRVSQFTQISITGNNTKQDVVAKKLIDHSPITIAQREELASVLLANQRPELAASVYEQLSVHDDGNKVHWLKNAAKWAEASGDPAQAAHYTITAAEHTQGVEKLSLVEESERLLIAAGDNETAFKYLASRIANSDDPDLVRQGIVLARQLGKHDIAALWNQKLVSINPVDVDAVNTQVDLALASGQLPDAHKWARHAVGLTPDSVAARTKLAQVAEWNGEPVAAQMQWEWLAKNNPSAEHYTQLVRLSELNRDSAVASEALLMLVMLQPTDQDQINRLVKLYELEGQPLKAADLLVDLQKRYGSSAATQRMLAQLYQYHMHYAEALAAWESYASNFGRSSEETLNRMELYWRLNNADKAADVSKHLIGTSNVSEASRFQVHLISEIAWRYRTPALAELVRPHISDIDDRLAQLVLGKKLVQSLEDAGKDREAIEEATRLWQSTNETDIAFTAMNLAYRTGQTGQAEPYLSESEDTAVLRATPEYWNLAASIHQKAGRKADAESAYEQALKIEPENTNALTGLLWIYIDNDQSNKIAAFLDTYKTKADTEPALWSAVAIAYLRIGEPEQSLSWFDRQLDRIDADYNMLLTYADALEYAGRAEPARKVRLYTVKKLRPVLAQGSSDDQDALIRQYAQLTFRYGSAEDKERVAQLLLAGSKPKSKLDIANNYWREDMAISWLMATDRHEHARIVMAKLHDERAKTPAWQELSVAMASNNLAQINQVLSASGNVSVGNHILALRQLGLDDKAYALAKSSAYNAPSMADRALAQQQVLAMRGDRPSYTGGSVETLSMNGLGVNQAGLNVTHTLSNMKIGFGVDVTNRRFTSDKYLINDEYNQSDVALSLYHGDRLFGGQITAGYNTTDLDQVAYGVVKQHIRSRDGRRTLSAEIAYNEQTTASPLLRVAALQNRAMLGYEQMLGHREFIRLQADMNEINTRISESRVARGLQTRIELGVKGSLGANAWTTSVIASRANNQLENELPPELAIAPTVEYGSILTDENTTLSFGGSLSRGGLQTNYPQSVSPRYYINANVGRSWPNANIGLTLNAGAGIRVLGGDELSIGFSHDTQPLSTGSEDNDTTRMGVNYRYHF